MSKPIPAVDEVSRPFWEASANGRLLLQHCPSCEQFVHYPRRWCPGCWHSELEQREVTGEGKVLSFTIVHQGPEEAFTAEGPYVLAIIRLDEGVSLLSNIVGDGSFEVAIDDRVSAVFDEVREGIVLPQFKRTSIPGR